MKLFALRFNKFLVRPFFILMLLLLGSCQSIDVRGQFVSDNAIEEINSKKLTQDKIIDLIGTPTYVPEYTNNTWYYIQRSLAKRAWFEPKVVEQRIVKITFNNKEKVSGASLLQDIHNENINIESKYTKAQGTEQGSLQKFVKNIGRFNKTTDGKKKRQKNK